MPFSAGSGSAALAGCVVVATSAAPPRKKAFVKNCERLCKGLLFAFVLCDAAKHVLLLAVVLVVNGGKKALQGLASAATHTAIREKVFMMLMTGCGVESNDGSLSLMDTMDACVLIWC